VLQDRDCLDGDFRSYARIVDEEQKTHLLNFQARNVHAGNNIWEQRNHVIVAHGHVGDNLLKRDLLAREVLLLLSAAVQLEAKLGHFASGEQLGVPSSCS
jgi:hypothetical protein